MPDELVADGEGFQVQDQDHSLNNYDGSDAMALIQ